MASENGGKWNKTALLVIDMQKDFVLPGAPMLVKGGEAIVPNVIKAVEVARSRGIPIIWVVREHDQLGRDVELFRRHLYGDGKPKPASKGSVGAELVDGLVIEEDDYKLVKTRFSAFFNTNLHSYLQGIGITNLVIIGVQTPNCIRQTVFDAVALDYERVTVIIDATAAATPDVHIGPNLIRVGFSYASGEGEELFVSSAFESSDPAFQFNWQIGSAVFANIFDMKNVGVATPTLDEWCQSTEQWKC